MITTCRMEYKNLGLLKRDCNCCLLVELTQSPSLQHWEALKNKPKKKDL